TSEPAARPEPFGRGSAALLGLGFFLQLTLFANLGRLQQMSGSTLIPAALTAQVGLATGLAAAAAKLPALRLVVGIVLLVLLSAAPLLDGASALLMVPANAASVILLVGACSRGTSGRALGAYAGTMLGAALLFVLLFGFYTRYEATGLWPLAGVLLALAALGRGADAPPGITKLAFLLPLVASIAAAGALIPATQNPGAATARIRALTYNIHQGFDADGRPAAQRIADVLAAAEADVIALQEVGRGWNLLGGADLVAYLRWRLPHYEIRFVQLNGELWGNAILSQWPIVSLDGGPFGTNEAFRYGFMHAVTVVDTDSVHVYSVHLSADLSSPVQSIRSVQARELMAQVAPRRSIVLGDFNATPGSDVLGTMTAGGLTDAAAESGLGSVGTWPARSGTQRLDYVLLTPDLGPGRAQVLATTASDHRPVMVDLRPIR
ncbi:MAG TPA: endonuclease/exonuclease/phosphatase family protein, partial [Longimicrobiales bacterium]|nr:endonuclease/exonuclease/phosphatase family protein [Longimicrobiales bacterium]